MFHKKTIRDIQIRNKAVLVRVDFNVPLKEDGSVADDYRIEKSIPTIQYLIERNCKIALAAHLGRPGGKKDPKLTMKAVAQRLSELLSQEVHYMTECAGPAVTHTVKSMRPGSVIMLENLRFYPGEKANDEKFAKELTRPFDYFVQNAFGNAHREDASMVAAAHAKPAVAGLLIEEEVIAIESALKRPRKPVTAVVGGAKIHTKLDLLNNLIRIADTVVVGGAMANTFLVALGHSIGKSLYEEDELGPARAIREAAAAANTELMLPLLDVAVAKQVDASAARRDILLEHVAEDDIILDFGRQSLKPVLEVIDASGTVLWNGPLGMTELPKFAQSTTALANHMVDHHVDSIVGGGDTAGFVHEHGLVDKLTHVSTGGGASLELMSGNKLPAVEVLLDA